MRIKSKWHNNSKKSIAEMGSALAFICWRITKNHLEDLINEGFKVEKNQLFAIISSYLYFLINCIDRLVFDRLTNEQRKQLLSAIVKQCAFYYQENKADTIISGDYIDEFIAGYNFKSKEYSICNFLAEPDYNFLRIFASDIKNNTAKIDEKWIMQQMIEIQAPKAFKKIRISVDDIINVGNIISKAEKSQREINKIPRAKRKK